MGERVCVCCCLATKPLHTSIYIIFKLSPFPLCHSKANKTAVKFPLLFLTLFNYSCLCLFMSDFWCIHSLCVPCVLFPFDAMQSKRAEFFRQIFSCNQSKFNLTNFSMCFCYRFANTANNRASDWYDRTTSWTSYIELQSWRFTNSKYSMV